MDLYLVSLIKMEKLDNKFIKGDKRTITKSITKENRKVKTFLLCKDYMLQSKPFKSPT